MSDKVFILNGPNLNLLGSREPEIYGTATLAEIEAAAKERARSLALAVDFRQTNHEGALIDWVQEAGTSAAGLILNPGAFTHSSIALHDALKALRRPKIELHLSNTQAREPFRRISYVSPAVDAIIAGLGADGYLVALDALKRLIDKSRTQAPGGKSRI